MILVCIGWLAPPGRPRRSGLSSIAADVPALSISDASGAWEKLCAHAHAWWGHTLRNPESPALAVVQLQALRAPGTSLTPTPIRSARLSMLWSRGWATLRMMWR